jgi:hypothetical protein
MRGHDSQRKREKEAVQRAERLIARQRAQRASKARAEFVTTLNPYSGGTTTLMGGPHHAHAMRRTGNG